MDEPLKKQLVRRWGALRTERASWWMHWSEISSYLLPRSGRFFVQDRDRGYKRHNNIYDNTGTRALNILAAGLMGGLTSPARPWFRLGTMDAALMEVQAVKIWLSDCTSLMLDIFQKSNTYRALHQMYLELGAFGTAVSVVADDFDNVIHHYPLTIGEYAVATDWKGDVCTLYREFQKTVSEIVKEFGYTACSPSVQRQFDNGSLDTWVSIIHAIEPREDRDHTKQDAKNMPWRSVYFETGGNPDQVLRESGFTRFRALAPRWSVSGGDIYGTSPAMEALGDVKQLQHEQLRKAQGIDYQTNPPLQVPSSMKNRDVERLPGGISFVDSVGPQSGIRTAFDVQLNLQYLLADIQDVRGRINSSFFADLFMMISQDNPATTRMTATEVAERHEEKMLMLGPVLERLHNELLNPLIEITFERMMQTQIMPPPPPELHGQQLNVELVSMLAQAQRAIATNGIDRFVGNMIQIAQAKPDVLDKFNSDRWADEYSDMLGVNPELLVSDDDVQALRAERAKQQQQMQQMAAQEQASKSMANLGKVQTPGGSNAGADILGMFSGYNSGGQ